MKQCNVWEEEPDREQDLQLSPKKKCLSSCSINTCLNWELRTIWICFSSYCPKHPLVIGILKQQQQQPQWNYHYPPVCLVFVLQRLQGRQASGPCVSKHAATLLKNPGESDAFITTPTMGTTSRHSLKSYLSESWVNFLRQLEKDGNEPCEFNPSKWQSQCRMVPLNKEICVKIWTTKTNTCLNEDLSFTISGAIEIVQMFPV